MEKAAEAASRRKGELSANKIGRERPEQVARVSAIRSWARTTISSTNSAGSYPFVRVGARCGDVTYSVFCIANASQAEQFCEKFGGERFDPKDRGRGSAWFL
jgi:hypothetical protein